MAKNDPNAGKPTADVQIKVRVSAGVRDMIEASAKSHGVSANAEINGRLRRSFERDREIGNFLESREAIGIAKLLAAITSEVGKIAGFQSNLIAGASKWYDDPYAFDTAARAAQQALDLLRPEGNVQPPRWGISDAKERARIEQSLATQVILQLVAGDLRFGNQEDRLADTRDDLGELYVRLCHRLEKAETAKKQGKRK